ncbi:MAG: hypothetical protein RIK87_10420 [Fuerstiella sp.]
MPESLPQLPAVDDYLPDWTAHRFVIIDPTARWASAISAEITQRLQHPSAVAAEPLPKHSASSDRASQITVSGQESGRRRQPPMLESCRSTRDALHFCELENTVGIVLFLNGLERDSLGLLGRLARLPRQLPLLVVAPEHHSALLPLLMEAGADGVLFDVRHDIPVADWCLRILQRHRS